MKQDHTACPRGWERIWSTGPALSEFWSQPEPSVVEWARGFEPETRVLDLGCGVGRNMLALAQMGVDAVGGDASPAGLFACAARMRRAGFSPLLVRHDMARLPFANGSFHALLSFHVVYHTTLTGVRQVLAEIHRVVRPGGHLYVTFLGKLDENIARYRADVVRGLCQEVEPFTFIYFQPAHGDKDIPHHYCDEAELRELLTDFCEVTLLPVKEEYSDDSGAHHVSLHYHVQMRRPVT